MVPSLEQPPQTPDWRNHLSSRHFLIRDPSSFHVSVHLSSCFHLPLTSKHTLSCLCSRLISLDSSVITVFLHRSISYKKDLNKLSTEGTSPPEDAASATGILDKLEKVDINNDAALATETLGKLEKNDTDNDADDEAEYNKSAKSAKMSARQSPAPSPPPPSQHPAYAAAPGIATNYLPNTVNQADMQHVLNLINQISQIRESNRKEAQRLFDNVEILGDRQLRMNQQARAAGETQSIEPGSTDESGQATSSTAWVDPIEHANLQQRLNKATQERDNLKVAFDDVAETLTQYEDTLESIMVRVREFAHQHTMNNIAWHKYYNDALQKERDVSHQLRLEHSRWQESLGRLSGYLRQAYDAQETLLLPYETQIAGLKRVNKVLKRRCGLEFEDSDDEEETSAPASANLPGHSSGPSGGA